MTLPLTFLLGTGGWPEPLALSWRAQNRLHTRFVRLLGRRLQRNKALVAVARELSGFIWELLRDMECYNNRSTIPA